MNKQGPGKIGWTDWTWNMLRGPCPVACWYCHARRRYHQFGVYETPKFIIDELLEPSKKKPAKIFTCSTFELFHPDVKPGIRDAVFNVIENCPQHTFQILTKMPENIDRPMPDNVWLGVSVGDDRRKSGQRAKDFISYIKKNNGFYFMSLEPLIHSEISIASFESIFPYFGWIIVGRLTGHGKKQDPPKIHIEWIVENCEQLQIPVFLKDNLKDIWGESLIQEFPKEGI